jgi:glyceraldehyde 3-phosphate dehydrogenase
VEEVNNFFRQAILSDSLSGILAVTDEPLVSSDIIGRRESAIVDLDLTQVIGGDLVKVFAWYDNEWGYSNRLVETVRDIANN